MFTRNISFKNFLIKKKKLIEKKAIVPSEKEKNENLPSRSAKLRYVKKKTDFYDFETDILDQFKNLIEIENFGDKL